MKNKVSFNIYQTLSNFTIKECLKYFHVGKGKIEQIRILNEIYVNDTKVDLNFVVKENDIITIYCEEEEITPIKHEIEILYEDDYFIAVNKQENILIHDDGNNNETLINYVAHYLKKTNKASVLYPLHRLDLKTKGVILFAKNFLSCAQMSYLIENRCIKKEYLLYCEGILKNKKGEINLFLGKNRHDSQKMIVLNKKGIKASTRYEVLKEYQNYSKVKVELLTGRKHQIRVSFSYIGHPVLNDDLYGKVINNGSLKLLAYSLSFIHPFTLKKVIIKCIDNLDII